MWSLNKKITEQLRLDVLLWRNLSDSSAKQRWPDDHLTCCDFVPPWVGTFVETFDHQTEVILVSRSQTGQPIDRGCILQRKPGRPREIMYNGIVRDIRGTEIPRQRDAGLLNISYIRKRWSFRPWNRSQQMSSQQFETPFVFEYTIKTYGNLYSP